MSDVTVAGCKVCVINPRGKNSEYCNRGYSQATCADVGEAYERGEQNERNRIIAKLREKGRAWAQGERHPTPEEESGWEALRDFADELEAET